MTRGPWSGPNTRQRETLEALRRVRVIDGAATSDLGVATRGLKCDGMPAMNALRGQNCIAEPTADLWLTKKTGGFLVPVAPLRSRTTTGPGVDGGLTPPLVSTSGSVGPEAIPTPSIAGVYNEGTECIDLTITWGGEGEVEFTLYRDGVFLATTEETTYSDCGLGAGTYCYTVLARSGGRTSDTSDEDCVAVLGDVNFIDNYGHRLGPTGAWMNDGETPAAPDFTYHYSLHTWPVTYDGSTGNPHGGYLLSEGCAGLRGRALWKNNAELIDILAEFNGSYPAGKGPDESTSDWTYWTNALGTPTGPAAMQDFSGEDCGWCAAFIDPALSVHPIKDLVSGDYTLPALGKSAVLVLTEDPTLAFTSWVGLGTSQALLIFSDGSTDRTVTFGAGFAGSAPLSLPAAGVSNGLGRGLLYFMRFDRTGNELTRVSLYDTAASYPGIFPYILYVPNTTRPAAGLGPSSGYILSAEHASTYQSGEAGLVQVQNRSRFVVRDADTGEMVYADVVAGGLAKLLYEANLAAGSTELTDTDTYRDTPFHFTAALDGTFFVGIAYEDCPIYYRVSVSASAITLEEEITMAFAGHPEGTFRFVNVVEA